MRPMDVVMLTDDERWQAVLGRDGTHDGAFVYAVRSTGVFCRPSCPARRPRRERVEFFPTAEEAGRAGYRPCRRCAPDGDDRAGAAVAAACRLLDGPGTAPTLAELGRAVGMSPYHLQRVFTRLVGCSPSRYAAARRLDRARAALRAGSSVTEALYDAGYGSSRAFYEGVVAGLGMTPGRYRRGGDATTVAYTVAASPFGRLLLAVTPAGVCAVRFADDDAALEAELARELPRAVLHREDEGLAPLVDAVLAHHARAGEPLDLPLDVRATAFQARVWQALRAIPAGQVRSYAEIARAVGVAGGARAVGAACAANPVALLVPCHRATRAGGATGGYRWGPERKERLLAAEAEAASQSGGR